MRSNSSWRLFSRFRICACTETSSAETGSSQTISFGLKRERARDADPLPLAARELVRVAVVVLRAQAHAIEQLADAALHVLLGLVDRERLADDLADALARVQRRVRVLEDDLHLAAQRPQSAGCESRVMSWPSKRTVPDVGSSSRTHQARCGRLAASGLADDPERLAAVHASARRPRPRARTPFATREHALPDREVLRQVLDLDERHLAGALLAHTVL